MRLISDVAAQKLISEQKKNIPELLKKHKPTSAEQGMYLAFRIANRCIGECTKETHFWNDAKENPPKRNGLFLVTVKNQNGEPRVRTVYFIDGNWTGNFEVTHWTYLPSPYREDMVNNEA